MTTFRSCILFCCLSTSAWAAESARITLTDGTLFEAEIVATESQGFRVRTDQGTWILGFEQLADYTTLPSTTTRQSSPLWTVVLFGEPEALRLARPLLEGVQGVVTTNASEALKATAASCNHAMSCLDESAPASAWTAYVHASLTPELLSLEGIHGSQHVPHATTGSVAAGPIALYGAAAMALGLEAPTEVPAPIEAHVTQILDDMRRAERSAMPPARLNALSFVPLPGLPSLIRRDYAGFAGALASAGALTAAVVATTGVTSTKTEEHVVLSLVGAYLASVSSSQLFGRLSLDRKKSLTVAAAPQLDPSGQISGATVQLHLTGLGARR